MPEGSDAASAFEARELATALDALHGLIGREPAEAALSAIPVAEAPGRLDGHS